MPRIRLNSPQECPIPQYSQPAQRRRARWPAAAIVSIALVSGLVLSRQLPARAGPASEPMPLYAAGSGRSAAEADAGPPIVDPPGLPAHTNQAGIDDGSLMLADVLAAGAQVFNARFNAVDGEGRPAATGDAKPTKRVPSGQPPFIRTSAPDANSCAGCHYQPTIGGSGDFVANVFLLAQFLDPPTESIAALHSNERNTSSLLGSGAVEMLAREMTTDLLHIRQLAEDQARTTRTASTLPLMTKGVSFGSITVHPDGIVDGSAIEGVDADLVIKPFSAKGAIISLREFTITAMNHHHGMQAIERFGWQRTGVEDFDEDGVLEELTIGDMTAAAVFQAALPIPGRVLPADSVRRQGIANGERLFSQLGCTACHIPALPLNNASFSEPNPYNRPGNLRPQHVPQPFTFDLTAQGIGNRLEKTENGGAIVRLYADLKRHRICDEEDPFFCNETLRQDNIPTDQFITPPLWQVGSTAPYGHRGTLTTLSEAIMHHAGEARASRHAFEQLSRDEQREVVAFLYSLQVLPQDALAVFLAVQAAAPVYGTTAE